jgi:tRNA(Leu) C34 or U34 (ribose-2'-O)-methylase TrmL
MRRGFASIGLFNPKNSLNYGGVMRAAGCYGASMVAIQGQRFRKSSEDTQSSWRHIPTLSTEDLLAIIPAGAIPVAVEFIPTARDLRDYTHPESAFYIFGPEDGNVSDGILKRCRDVIYVPTEFCMNLAATVNVVLYDRMAKQKRT